MSADAPPQPWKLNCPKCGWYVLASNRGARGKDPGAGVEAHELREQHIREAHNGR